MKFDRVPEGFRPSSPYSGLLPGGAGLIFLVSLYSSDSTGTFALPDAISGNFQLYVTFWAFPQLRASVGITGLIFVEVFLGDYSPLSQCFCV